MAVISERAEFAISRIPEMGEVFFLAVETQITITKTREMDPLIMCFIFFCELLNVKTKKKIYNF